MNLLPWHLALPPAAAAGLAVHSKENSGAISRSVARICSWLRPIALEQSLVVVDECLLIRMPVAGGAGELEKYLQRAAIQWLGLGQPVRGLQQKREVVEGRGNIGMIRPQTFLQNGQRAALQRLCLG